MRAHKRLADRTVISRNSGRQPTVVKHHASSQGSTKMGQASTRCSTTQSRRPQLGVSRPRQISERFCRIIGTDWLSTSKGSSAPNMVTAYSDQRSQSIRRKKATSSDSKRLAVPIQRSQSMRQLIIERGSTRYGSLCKSFHSDP